MNAQELAQALLGLTEYKPRSVELLRQLRTSTGEMYPSVPLGERQRCFREMRDYANRANDMAEKLLNLKPIPIESPDHEALRSVFL